MVARRPDHWPLRLGHLVTSLGLLLNLSIGVAAPAITNLQAEILEYCPADYNIKTFQTKSFSGANVDLLKSYKKGYQWYFWNWFSGPNQSDRAMIDGDGVINVWGESGPNGQLQSAAAIPSPPYFTGIAFGGGFCLEAEISFDSDAVERTNGRWPSFWAMSQEHLLGRLDSQWPSQAAGYEHFVELDLLEYYKKPPPEYLGSVIEWFGIYTKSCAPERYCRTSSSIDNTPGVIPKDTKWKGTWHKIGAVWQPATQRTRGMIRYFFDQKPLGPAWTWPQTALDSNPPRVGPLSSTIGIIDHQHMVLMLGSNSTPIRIRSVTVFQPSNEKNLVNRQ